MRFKSPLASQWYTSWQSKMTKMLTNACLVSCYKRNLNYIERTGLAFCPCPCPIYRKVMDLHSGIYHCQHSLWQIRKSVQIKREKYQKRSRVRKRPFILYVQYWFGPISNKCPMDQVYGPSLSSCCGAEGRSWILQT